MEILPIGNDASKELQTLIHITTLRKNARAYRINKLVATCWLWFLIWEGLQNRPQFSLEVPRAKALGTFFMAPKKRHQLPTPTSRTDEEIITISFKRNQLLFYAHCPVDKSVDKSKGLEAWIDPLGNE